MMWFLTGIHGCITVVAQKPALIGRLQGIHFECAMLFYRWSTSMVETFRGANLGLDNRFHLGVLMYKLTYEKWAIGTVNMVATTAWTT